MDGGVILRILVLGVLHWILAGMLLQDLSRRKKVLGGKKWPWAAAIMFLTFIGSMVYMLCHPQMFFRDEG